jgi:hypothetical protein
MSSKDRTTPFVPLHRYAEFRDASGSWTFEIEEYQEDINSITPVDISSAPDRQEAYRAAVFLEGFIEEQKRAGHWSPDSLDRFESFESTIEVEAVAKALGEMGRFTSG